MKRRNTHPPPVLTVFQGLRLVGIVLKNIRHLVGKIESVPKYPVTCLYALDSKSTILSFRI